MSQNSDFKNATALGFVAAVGFLYWLVLRLTFLRGSILVELAKPVEPGSQLAIWAAMGVFLACLFCAVALATFRVLQRVGLRQTGRKLEFTQRELRHGMPGAQLLRRRS